MKKIYIGSLLVSVLFFAGCAAKNTVPTATNPAPTASNPVVTTTSQPNLSGPLDDSKFIEISAQLKCLDNTTLQDINSINKFFQSFGVTPDDYYKYYSAVTSRPDVVQIFTQVASRYQEISSANQCYKLK